MDIITEEQVEAARVALDTLVKEQKRQASAKAIIERVTKENATHSLVLERRNGDSYSGTYTIPGFRIQVLASNGWKADDKKKTRVSVSGAEDVDFTEAYEMSNGARGENPVVDKMFDKLNRQVIKNDRVVIEEAMAADAGLREMLSDVILHFSRNAGCSCGCSPAFIASHHITEQQDNRMLNITNIFISKVVTA